MPYELVTKRTFLSQLRALPARAVDRDSRARSNLLCDDPRPHEPVKKKKLKGYKDLYRLRSGDYRILYTYGDGLVTRLIGVDDRKDVYDGDAPDGLPDYLRQPDS